MSSMLPGSRALFRRLSLALGVLAAVTACASKPDAAAVYWQERLAAIVASPDRSAADRTNDVRRKPEQMLAFIGVRQGMVALDLSAGGGYTTELLARTVDPGGRVYAQVPRAPSAGLTARMAKPVLANATVVAQPFENPAPAEVASRGIDIVTIMFNYHDLGDLGVDRERMNRAVFAALKPGGLYVVADHSGRRRHRHLGIGHAAPGRGGVREAKRSSAPAFACSPRPTSCATRTTRATARRPIRRSRRTSSS